VKWEFVEGGREFVRSSGSKLGFGLRTKREGPYIVGGNVN
jgi:hypothetical protein